MTRLGEKTGSCPGARFAVRVDDESGRKERGSGGSGSSTASQEEGGDRQKSGRMRVTQ